MKKPKILMLYRTFGPSVYLCGLIQFRWLAEHQQIELRHMPILKVQKKDLLWAECVVFVRGDGLLDEQMAKICNRNGKYIIYILDDDLLHVPPELGSGPYYAQKSVQRHIRRMLEYSSCFSSPSARLLQTYGQKTAFLLTEPSAYQIKKKHCQMDGKVHIGFAGSSDRGSDIDLLLTNALTVLTEKYGERISLEFFGCRTAIAEKLHCKTYPYVDSYEAYQAKMAELNWDIGLAPMPDTAFHACKHYNKLVEYCGYGIVGVYSAVPPYIDGVEHGGTGLLCGNTTQEWVEAISLLIENEPLRQQLSCRCIQYAQEQFSVERSATELFQNLSQLPLPEQMEDRIFFLNMRKLWGLFSWYFEKYKKYGWKTPVIAFQKIKHLIQGSKTKSGEQA